MQWELQNAFWAKVAAKWWFKCPLFFLNALTLTYKTFQLHFHLIPCDEYKVDVDLKCHTPLTCQSLGYIKDQQQDAQYVNIHHQPNAFHIDLKYIHRGVLNENAIEMSYM